MFYQKDDRGFSKFSYLSLKHQKKLTSLQKNQELKKISLNMKFHDHKQI